MEKFATGTTRKMEENTEEGVKDGQRDKARNPDKDKQSFFVSTRSTSGS